MEGPKEFDKKKFKEEREKISKMIYDIDSVLVQSKPDILKCDGCQKYVGTLKRKQNKFLCEKCYDTRKA